MDEQLSSGQSLIASTSPRVVAEPHAESIYGAVFSAAIADALGWVTEFMRSPQQLRSLYGVEKLTDFVAWEKQTGGRFNSYVDWIEPGSYSDDTQLTLCTARSLRADGTFDVEHFAKCELAAWPDYARGGGHTVLAAARAIRRRSASWDSNFFRYRSGERVVDYREAGANGAAMRIAPLVLANLDDLAQADHAVWQNSIVTHGHPRAIIGALVYGRALGIMAQDGRPSTSELHSTLTEYLRYLEDFPVPADLQTWRRQWNAGSSVTFEETWIATVHEMSRLLTIALERSTTPVRSVLETLGCFERATRGSGTGTVAGALAILSRAGGSLEGAIRKAVNMIGSDTDTIGALVGGLVGAAHGYTAIPELWAARLQDFDYFHNLADALVQICARRVHASGLEIDRSPRWADAPNIVDLVERRQAVKGQRVYHPALGPGWIVFTNAQRIRRKGGATILFARVEFDMGQSCVFHSTAGRVGERSSLPPSRNLPPQMGSA